MQLKRIMLLTLVMALLLPGLASAATVKTLYSDGSLVVRSGPGTNYEPASWVKNGQSITVLDKGGTWSLIMVDSSGKVGYIKAKYIVEGSQSGSTGSGSVSGDYELGTVTTRYASSRVNVRKGAGTGYGIVTSLTRGARLFIKGEQGNWYKVSTVYGDEGWISKTYVTDGIAARTTANVNLRKGPSTGRSVIKVLANGTGCRALAVDGNWTKVRAGNQTGWVYSSYISY